MKTLFLLCLQLPLGLSVYGQTFALQSSIPLPDTATFERVEWADVDNDGLLDVLAFGASLSDEAVCFLWRNAGVQGMLFAGYLNTALNDATWVVEDMDGDNSMDLIASGLSDEGPLTLQYLNKGDFEFHAETVLQLHGLALAMADLDADGAHEVLISGEENGEPFFNILEHDDGRWMIVHDSIKVRASDVEAFDFDGDGDLDFFVTGADDSGAKVSRAFYNQRSFYFTTQDLLPAVSGTCVKGDLNHDGSFDMLLAGVDDAGDARLVALLNDGLGNFLTEDTLVALTDATVFAGDLNSDGLSDINIFGFQVDGDTLNIIRSEGELVLSHKGMVSQSWGDTDRDGDLDLLQLVKTTNGFGFMLLVNTTAPTNPPPARPSGLVIAGIMNRLFISWMKATDERTPQNSITYDVAVHSAAGNIMAADFDLITGRRLVVSHGNNGTSDYMLLRGTVTSDVSVDIQAVDNSFHAGPGSICKGFGGGGDFLCSDAEVTNLELCENETVTLTGSPGTLWFSFEHGFLADTSVLAFDFHEPDTIFSLRRERDCAAIAVYLLSFGKNVTRITDSSELFCEGDVVQFGVEPDWQSVVWSSVSKGFLSNEDTVSYVVVGMDTVKVILSDANGCVIQRNTAVRISKPLIAGDDAYQILKGEAVRLGVSGGVTYTWRPPTGLDDPASAEPLASPLETTEYVVTARDTAGCESSMRIVVLVEETAFIPNLFTPNRDGKNDALKIYGLGQVTGFSFTIYNREGNRVYHTQDVADVVTEGWNGTAGGVDQPGGVYYWSVSGQTISGKMLQLNGRKSGSIVLVR